MTSEPLNADSPARAKRVDYWLPVFLGLHVLLLIAGILVHSPTRDEIAHLGKGLYMWRTGRFDVGLGNPPLCDLVATLPITVLYPQLAVGPSGHYLDVEAHRDDPAPYRRAIVWSRLVLIPFSIVGALVCYRWSGELGGRFAGRVALALWCTCPNILAYGQVVTGDLTCTATGILAGYAVWKWLGPLDTLDSVVAGLLVGTAMLSKMIWVIWLGLAPLLWFVWMVSDRPSWKVWCKSFAQLGLLLLTAVLWLNLGYAFEETCRPLSENRALRAGVASSVASSWLPDAMKEVPVPLPANYLRGLLDAHRVMTSDSRSYLRGEWRQRGWWYYYLYGLVVKIPLGTLALASLAAWYAPFAGIRWRDALVLLIPAAVITILVSLLDGLSHHFRYILPLFPFAFVWLAVAASEVGGTIQGGKWIVTACVGATMASSLAQYPHCMSYFNELAGGPRHGHRHLADSSIDWGQNLLLLRRWLDGHPDASPLHLAYFGSVAPQFAGIDFSVPAAGPRVRIANRDGEDREWAPVPGWYAVSANLVCGRPSESVNADGFSSHAEQDKFAYFQLLEPVDRVGHSIWIYHVSETDVERMRRQYGWSGSDAREGTNHEP